MKNLVGERAKELKPGTVIESDDFRMRMIKTFLILEHHSMLDPAEYKLYTSGIYKVFYFASEIIDTVWIFKDDVILYEPEL